LEDINSNNKYDKFVLSIDDNILQEISLHMINNNNQQKTSLLANTSSIITA